jgi:hypothetical protein
MSPDPITTTFLMLLKYEDVVKIVRFDKYIFDRNLKMKAEVPRPNSHKIKFFALQLQLARFLRHPQRDLN